MKLLNLVLIILNLLLLYVIVSPLLKRKFAKITYVKFNHLKDIEPKILSAAIEMATSNKVYMPFSEENSLYTQLAKLKSIVLRNKSHQNYTYFNFPRAWLLLGMYKYADSADKVHLKETVYKETKKLLDETGKLKFKFDKLDQVLFGLLFLELHILTGEEKYLKAVEEIYQKIQSFKRNDGIYLYRKKEQVIFIDTLGMLLPFLYTYADFLKSNELIDEANKQLTFYLEKTVHNEKEFPCHAYDLENEIKLGSNNWSRGMAWLIIGMAYAAKYNYDNNSVKDLFNTYYKKLKDLKIDNYWPQFFGNTNDYQIDASATIMFLFSKYFLNEIYDNEIDLALKNSIDENGFVENNSGDTIYINKYSRVKGKSELSQGLLLWILSLKKVI